MNISYMLMAVSENGIKTINKDIKCKQTAKGYVIYKESNFGGKQTRLSKDAILKVDSLIVSNLYYMIQVHTWYFKEDEDKARKLLLDSMKMTAQKQAKTAAILLGFTMEA